MAKVISDPFVEVVVPVHDGAHVLTTSICRLDDFLRPDPPLRTRITIAGSASTDGTDAISARPERELPGAPLLRLEQKGRDCAFRAEHDSAIACA